MNWVSIGSGNGLLPLRHQAITWTNAGTRVDLSIGLPAANSSEIWIWILSISFKKMDLKLSSANIAVIFSRERWVTRPFPCIRKGFGYLCHFSEPRYDRKYMYVFIFLKTIQHVSARVGCWHLGKPHQQNITFNLSKVADDWTYITGVWMHWK